MIQHHTGASNKPVVYMIYNTYSHGVYIGQAQKCKRRWRDGYMRILPRGTCHNKHLQNDYNKCVKLLGHDDFLEFFVLRVMEGSTQKERDDAEGHFIRFFGQLCFKLYNNVLIPATPCHSEATKQKISQTKKEFYKTEEGKALISKLASDKAGKTYEELYGHEKATEIKQKISENKLVEMNRPEVKENLRRLLSGKTEAERYGEAKAQEIKEKKSRARKGKYAGAKSSRFKRITNIRLQAPDGTVYTNIEGIKEFSKAHDLQQNHLSELLAGKRNSHHGWMLVIDDTP